jgi:hypothetical protein
MKQARAGHDARRLMIANKISCIYKDMMR